MPTRCRPYDRREAPPHDRAGSTRSDVGSTRLDSTRGRGPYLESRRRVAADRRQRGPGGGVLPAWYILSTALHSTLFALTDTHTQALTLHKVESLHSDGDGSCSSRNRTNNHLMLREEPPHRPSAQPLTARIIHGALGATSGGLQLERTDGLGTRAQLALHSRVKCGRQRRGAQREDPTRTRARRLLD